MTDGTTYLNRTQKRNARKREARQYKAERAAADALATAGSAAGTTSQDDELMKRKQALLKSFDAGPSPTVTPKKRKASDEEEKSKAAAQSNAPPSTPGSTTSQRKSRFDLAAPGRLLFGALGFSGSKNKEQKSAAQTNGHDETPEEKAPETPEDSDAWKDKITYRAVECVREGVELSEPPFPFVQRWDPQQQVDVWYGNKRGGKGKRKQRDQAHYYEEDPERKKRKVSPWPEELDYDEGANGEEAVENDLGGDEEQDFYEEPEDLPALPKDINTLTPLARGAAAPGMVITWKAWLLSKATNWQPQFGNLTGVVARLDKTDPDMLNVFLAKRDRKLDRDEKEYDQQGQRIYGGFEAPDLDGEEEGEDDGRRFVSFAEMMDPRVVHEPTAQLQAIFGSFDTPVPDDTDMRDDDAPIPESLPQDGQGDPNFEPFSMELEVPFSDPADGDGDVELPPAGAGDGKAQKNALDVPSGVSSVASGRRQPDPNSLPLSVDLDMTIPDSAPASPVEKKGGEGKRKTPSRSASRSARDSAPASPIGKKRDEKRKTPSRSASQSASRSASRSPKKARREGDTGSENPATDKDPVEVSDSASIVSAAEEIKP
ncbi:MAG: hypothetical protein IMZ46_04545, partial [Acidobacteria bacterium]|nr:hypothetical protein [Acidobacteriota bacterium]